MVPLSPVEILQHVIHRFEQSRNLKTHVQVNWIVTIIDITIKLEILKVLKVFS